MIPAGGRRSEAPNRTFDQAALLSIQISTVKAGAKARAAVMCCQENFERLWDVQNSAPAAIQDGFSRREPSQGLT
jgi:hypothetical protein